MNFTKSSLALSIAFGLLTQPMLAHAWDNSNNQQTLIAAGSSSALVGLVALRSHNQKVSNFVRDEANKIRASMSRDANLQTYMELREQMAELRTELADFKTKQANIQSVIQKQNLEVKIEMIREKIRSKNLERRALGKRMIVRLSNEERLMTSADVALRYHIKEGELFELSERTARKLRSGGFGSFLVIGGLAVAVAGYFQVPSEQSSFNEVFTSLSGEDQDKILNVLDSEIIDSDDSLAELVK